MDLVTWLRAQLDADEQVALPAAEAGAEWEADERGRVEVANPVSDSTAFEYTVVFDEGSPSGAQAAHIAWWDPARVLRELEAKRAILDLHHEYVGVCAYCVNARGEHQREPWPCPTFRLLALPYADRPGYRPEWAPEAAQV